MYIYCTENKRRFSPPFATVFSDVRICVCMCACACVCVFFVRQCASMSELLFDVRRRVCVCIRCVRSMHVNVHHKLCFCSMSAIRLLSVFYICQCASRAELVVGKGIETARALYVRGVALAFLALGIVSIIAPCVCLAGFSTAVDVHHRNCVHAGVQRSYDVLLLHPDNSHHFSMRPASVCLSHQSV